MPSTINELLAEFNDPPTSETELRRRCAELVRKFYDQYNFASWGEIEQAIRNQSISESALVDEWINLRAALEAMKMLPEHKPKRRKADQPQQGAAKAALSFFGECFRSAP